MARKRYKPDLFILRGIPTYIRSDNGPEFVAEAVRRWIATVGARTAVIEPGSPWENGYIEGNGLAAPIIEPGGLRVDVPGHLLRLLELRIGVLEIGGDAGAAEYSDRTVSHSITEEETVTIRADTALLGLLLLNITRNALLYNQSEIPRVDFTVSCDEHVHILCIDNGVGIPTDEWEAIFDRFYRLSSAPAGGTGIGLAICRRIAELHGGNIRVVKSSPAGTEIEVKLSAMK